MVMIMATFIAHDSINLNAQCTLGVGGGEIIIVIKKKKSKSCLTQRYEAVRRFCQGSYSVKRKEKRMGEN